MFTVAGFINCKWNHSFILNIFTELKHLTPSFSLPCSLLFLSPKEIQDQERQEWLPKVYLNLSLIHEKKIEFRGHSTWNLNYSAVLEKKMIWLNSVSATWLWSVCHTIQIQNAGKELVGTEHLSPHYLTQTLWHKLSKRYWTTHGN